MEKYEKGTQDSGNRKPLAEGPGPAVSLRIGGRRSPFTSIKIIIIKRSDDKARRN